MDTFTFVFILFLGIVLGIIVSILPFIDFLGMLSKVFPANVPSDFKQHKDFISSNCFQDYKRKWKKIFCLVSVVFAITYCLIAFLFDSILLALYGALIASVLYFGITSNIEHKQRKLLIFKSKKGQAGDSSVS